MWLHRVLVAFFLTVCVPLVVSAQPAVRREIQCASAVGTDTYACTVTGGPALYVTGKEYTFIADVANTGPASFNLNALGLKPIKKFDGSALVDLATDDICVGQIVVTRYDGINFQLISPPCTAAAGGITASSTDTFTNKTYDAAATGNVFTMFDREWWEAARCDGTTARGLWSVATSLAPTFSCVLGTTNNKMIIGTADFPDTDGEYAMQRTYKLPADWAGTSIDLFIYWSTNATSGNAFFQTTVICRADNESIDAAYNTAGSIADVAKAAANNLNTASITGVGITGCAAGELMEIRLMRDRTHASDTLASGGIVSVHGAELQFKLTK